MAKTERTNVKKRGKIGYSQYWQSELYEEVMNTYRAIDDTVDSIGQIINEMQTQTGRNWDTEPDVPKWFYDVLDTLDRARRELYYATINKSDKKSKMKKSSFDLEEELINKYPDVGSYFKVVADSTRNVLGSERYAEIKDEATRMIEWGEDKGYCMLASMSEEEREQVLNSALGKSTKKSTPDVKMSFAENVNKMRVNNYAKTGNINTVMRERR